MQVSRRQFLRYCTGSAAALGLSGIQLKTLADVLARGDGPNVIWLVGSGCSGCSVSFMNLISEQSPHEIGEVLIDLINLAYHPTIMAAAGETAAEAAQVGGEYILAVEGGVPTAFGGAACWAWTVDGEEATFQQVVEEFAAGASHIMCVGECSAWGGIPAAPPNPTGVVGVSQLTGRTTINVAGCPPHPDWIAWVLVRLLLGQPITLDEYGRPSALFTKKVHSTCPMKYQPQAQQFGQEGHCFEDLGCRGKYTYADCPDRQFNGGVNWCARAGSPCIGCANPDFPGTEAFFKVDA